MCLYVYKMTSYPNKIILINKILVAIQLPITNRLNGIGKWLIIVEIRLMLQHLFIPNIYSFHLVVVYLLNRL